MKKTGLTYSSMRPLYKWLLWILGGLLILLIVLQLFLSFYADDYVASRLKTKVRQGSDSTYALTFDDLNLNVFNGSVSIQNLQIHADTAAFSKGTAAGKPAKKLVQGHINQVDISGINIFSALWGNKLSIGTISITRPDLSVLKNPHPVKKDTSGQFSSVDSTIYATISNRYDALQLDEFNIKRARGLFSASRDSILAIHSLDLKLKNIYVDSVSAHSGRRFITDDISLDVRRLMLNLPDSLNKIRLARLSISSADQSIALDSLQLIPRYPRFKFSRKKGVEIDHINLTVPQVRLQKVDFSRWIDSSRFYASTAVVNKAVMNDFRDKNRPFPPDHHPPLPHMAFKKMAAKIKIDTIRVKNSFISYAEYWYRTPKAGRITFEDLDATITNLSNYPEAIQNGSTITMDARARVMGKAVLDTHFEFPMNTSSGFHKVSGTLGAMPLADFNRMLKYVAFVRIDEGQLNSLKFDMTLTGDRSSGTLIMNYENLKISVLDKNSMEQKGLMENLKTFAANKLIINENNTPEDGMQAGRISFERIQRKSVFNYWWKSLLSGIKTSVK